MQRVKLKLTSLFTRHLLLGNTLTSCAQLGVADVLQQLIHDDMRKNGWDWRRTVRMAGTGIILAPMLHGFYRVLDTRRFTGTHKVVTLKKLFFDTAAIPFFSCSFMIISAFYEGQDLRGAWKEYRKKMVHIWMVDFSIWPPAQLINFYFLPNSLRIVYINVVSLIYNCIMSYIKNNDVAEISLMGETIASKSK